jgi:glycosyltransferase involved in cell wall biosynthesis
MNSGPILIDIPKSFIENTFHLSGANTLSKQLSEILLHKFESVILYSDASKDLINETKWLNHSSIQIISSLTELEKITEQPVIAFSSSLSISKFLQARNFLRLSFPIVGIIHSLGTPETISSLSQSLTHITANDSFICPSQATQTTLKQIASHFRIEPIFKSKVIKHGINTTKFSMIENSEKCRLRDSYKFNHDDTILLHVSRLSPFTKMDIFPMIKSLTTPLKENPKLKLWIVGTNHLPSYIKMIQKYVKTHQLESQIIFEMKPSHDSMEKYYQTSDIFLFMSDCKAETFGLTTAEAMSCGLPIVISDVSGISEIVDHDTTGFIIPTLSGSIGLEGPASFGESHEFGDKSIQGTAFSHHHFLKAIEKLQDNLIRNSMGEAGQEKAKEHLTIDKMVESYITYFNELIQSQNETTVPELNFQHVESILLHNTTHYLSGMTTITITKTGTDIFLDKTPFFCMSSHLESYPFMYSILRYLNKKQTLFVNEIRQHYSCSPKWIDATLIYMIKHDLISWS